ncbi:MAG: hypothetical protein Q9181_006743 [Wetmoreana brouardii]
MQELQDKSSKYPLVYHYSKAVQDTVEVLDLDRDEKRAYVLYDDDGWQPDVGAEAAFSCRWWQRGDFRWELISKSSSPPSHNMIRQAQASKVRNCMGNPAREEGQVMVLWGLQIHRRLFSITIQLESGALRQFERRQGILWLMKRSRPGDDDDLSTDLRFQSQVFFSYTEYAAIPRYAIDLLPSMIDKIESIWKNNLILLGEHLASKRYEILKASGKNPKLIQDLLHNACLLELLRDNLNQQTERLARFAEQYQDASFRILHEMPDKDVKARMSNFSKAIRKLSKDTGPQLRNLTASCQNLIGLVGTSIDETEWSLTADIGIQLDIYYRSAEIDVNKQQR